MKDCRKYLGFRFKGKMKIEDLPPDYQKDVNKGAEPYCLVWNGIKKDYEVWPEAQFDRISDSGHVVL